MEIAVQKIDEAVESSDPAVEMYGDLFNLLPGDFGVTRASRQLDSSAVSTSRENLVCNQKFVSLFQNCKSYQAISLEAGSSFCLLRSLGNTTPQSIDRMRRIQSALRDEIQTPFLIFADMRIENLLNSLAPR